MRTVEVDNKMKEFRAMINFGFVELTVKAQDEEEGKAKLLEKLESIIAIASDVQVIHIAVIDKGEVDENENS